jgi:hypothetical protein
MLRAVNRWRDRRTMSRCLAIGNRDRITLEASRMAPLLARGVSVTAA